MGIDNDWLMGQVKGVSNIIGTVLRLEVMQIDLGNVEDEEGREIKGEDYLNSLIQQERFSEVNVFIKKQMQRINSVEYNMLVERYIKYLSNLNEETLSRNKLDKKGIRKIENELQKFEWYQ